MWAPYSSNAMALGIITLHWVFYMKKGGTGSSLILEFKKLEPEVINKSKYPPTPVYICVFRHYYWLGKEWGRDSCVAFFAKTWNLKLKNVKKKSFWVFSIERNFEIKN